MDIKVREVDLGPQPYRKLRNQMIMVMLMFGLIPLMTMGVAGIWANLYEIETRTRNVLEAMVKNRKASIELFLEEKHRELELIAHSLSKDDLSKPELMENLLDQMKRERGGIIDLGFIDTNGNHLVYVGPYNLHDKNYSGEDWFRQVMVFGYYMSDVFLGFRQFPHMVIAVKKREGGQDYCLRATIDTDLLSKLVMEGGVESGADVFILNKKWEYQTKYSEEHKLMEKADIDNIPMHSGVRVVEKKDGSHREFIATTWLLGNHWVLVAKQEVLGVTALLKDHPELPILFGVGLILIPLLANYVARLRLSQVKTLENRHTLLLESIAHSQKMAAIGRLAAGIAHEINNPLAIIQAQTGVLRDLLEDNPDLPCGKDFSERLQKIDIQVERAKKVTHRLLGFSKRVGPDLQSVDICSALDETIGFVEKELEACRINVVKDYEKVRIIRASLSQIQQVFLNLVNNAVDAIGKGGEIKLIVREKGEGVEVQVQDNGRGIPKHNLGKIFDPFFTTKDDSRPHSGLGLAICAEIMRGMGGTISVASEEGKGTTFTLWFPFDVESRQT